MKKRYYKVRFVGRACNLQLVKQPVIENKVVKEESKPVEEPKPAEVIPEEPKDPNEYKFELYSYGYLSDTIYAKDKADAVWKYFKFEDSTNFAYKFYLNGELIPNKKIKETLNIDYKQQWQYYKTRPNNLFW